MKISQSQKELNRIKLLYCGVDIMVEEGIKNATMKKIATRAGISEAGIYKYYPTKEHLLFDFFETSFLEALKQTEQIPGFFEAPFCEQIQYIIDCQLEQFQKHKSFVSEAFKTLFLTTLTGSMTYLSKQRSLYIDYVGKLMDAAISAEEISESPLKGLLVDLLWDFHLGIIYYWLNDSSKNNTRTTQLIDKSLGLFNDLLKSNILSKAADLFYYLVREHFFLKEFEKSSPLSENQKEQKKTILSKKNVESNSKNQTRKK